MSKDNTILTLPKKSTFKQWCEQNSRQDLLNRWDYEANIYGPDEIPHYNSRPIHLKCPKGKHPNSIYITMNITGSKKNKCLCPYCNSIAQTLLDMYGDNGIKDHWSEKNTEDPWTVPRGTTKKYWFKCTKNKSHPDYLQAVSSTTSGCGCPYCHHLKVVPGESLADEYPESIPIWSPENKKTPYDYYPGSVHKAKWICPNGHQPYMRPIKEQMIANFNCPKCSQEEHQSSLQLRVSKYLSKKYPDYPVYHEYECSIVPHHPENKKTMPFDNEVVLPGDKRLIIEVHGQQHYEITLYTKMSAKSANITPEQVLNGQKFRDAYKKEYALSNGYYYLAISYMDMKSKTYQNLIDNKINEITNKLN